MATKSQIPQAPSEDFANYAADMLASLKRIANNYEMTLLGNLIEFARIEAARNAQAPAAKERGRTAA